MKRLKFSLRTLLLFVFGIGLLMFPFEWTLRPAATIQVVDIEDRPFEHVLLEFNNAKKVGGEIFVYRATDSNGECTFPAVTAQRNVISHLLAKTSERTLIITAPYGSFEKWYFEPEFTIIDGMAYSSIRMPCKSTRKVKR
jgi:hypothetical protein